MPFIFYPSMYSRTDDYNTEVAVNYQLGFLVDSALISLRRILREHAEVSTFRNKTQYYHYYVDHLLMCLGRIHDYFVLTSKNKAFIDLNRNLYNYSETDFPIISKKHARNLVEHLVERNKITIDTFGGVGGFNVIFKGSHKDFKNSIKENRKYYPYTLDLTKNKIIFSDNLNTPCHLYPLVTSLKNI